MNATQKAIAEITAQFDEAVNNRDGRVPSLPTVNLYKKTKSGIEWFCDQTYTYCPATRWLVRESDEPIVSVTAECEDYGCAYVALRAANEGLFDLDDFLGHVLPQLRPLSNSASGLELVSVDGRTPVIANNGKTWLVDSEAVKSRPGLKRALNDRAYFYEGEPVEVQYVSAAEFARLTA